MGDDSAQAPGEGIAIGAANWRARMLASRAICEDGWAGGVTGDVSTLGEDVMSRSWPDVYPNMFLHKS
jgi:hypothetical protein